MSQYWYIALIPDEPEYTRVNRFAAYLSERFCREVDRPSPPLHITLVAPFKANESVALAALRSLEGIVPSFSVNTSKFEHLPEYRTWYLGIEQHRYFANLETIARQQLGDAAPDSYPDRIYHLTVARYREKNEGATKLEKVLSHHSAPCAKLRFKQIVLIRRKNDEHPAAVQHAITLYPAE